MNKGDRSISTPITVGLHSHYSANELLDITLEALIVRPENAMPSMLAAQSAEDLYNALHSFGREHILILDHDEFWSILDKLESDGYIKKSLKAESTNNMIRITFIGLFFIRDGGYTKKELDEAKENERLSTLEESQKNQAIQMLYLTGLLTVGTIIAGLYYFLQIFDGKSKEHPIIAIVSVVVCFGLFGLWIYKKTK